MIDRARDCDTQEIYRIEKAAFGNASYYRREMEWMLRYPGAITFVHREGGRIQGYVSGAMLDLSTGSIESLAVRPACRGQGVASALLDAMELEFSALGATASVLEVREMNSSAMRLYAARGYTASEFLENYYRIPFLGSRNAFRMYRALGPGQVDDIGMGECRGRREGVQTVDGQE